MKSGYGINLNVATSLNSNAPASAIYAEVIDVWTPDEMLSTYVNDYVNIKGSLYDDWHIGPQF